MRPAYRRITRHAILLFACLSADALAAPPASAAEASQKILSRPELGPERRQELADKLRVITGWPGLHFDREGTLRFGEEQPAGGSRTARALLADAAAGKNLIVLEDASGRGDVVFCRVVEGRWERGARARPPVFIVQIDFTDFSRVMGDKAALAAFDVGWGVLHEIDHVVNDTTDSVGPGAVGECEGSINRMRRERGLAERAEYLFTYLPGAENSDFKTRYVRLAFERRDARNKPKRHWLYWDAALVGGLPSPPGELAAAR